MSLCDVVQDIWPLKLSCFISGAQSQSRPFRETTTTTHGRPLISISGHARISSLGQPCAGLLFGKQELFLGETTQTLLDSSCGLLIDWKRHFDWFWIPFQFAWFPKQNRISTNKTKHLILSLFLFLSQK